MVANRVASRAHRPRHFGQPLHVGADLEEGGGDFVCRQDLQNPGRVFARTVVKG